MIETKNLEGLLNEGKIELFKHRRELLISPTDSGKLNMIVSQAHLFNNILYLCDNIHHIIKFRERAMYLASFIWFFFADDTVFSAPDRLQILMMTAEPQYIEEFQQEVPWVNSYHTIELKDN
jgi:hypothetical protein